MSPAKRRRSATSPGPSNPPVPRPMPGTKAWYLNQNMPVFTPGQVKSLLQAATDLAKGLEGRYSASRKDTVVILGDSPAWLYQAFRALGYHNRYSCVHLPLSGRPYEEGRYENEIQRIPLGQYRDKALKPLFPIGLHGTIWLVDYSGGGESIDGAIRLLAESNASLGHAGNTYGIEFILLRSPKWSASNRIPCQAFSIALKDPPEEVGRVPDFITRVSAMEQDLGTSSRGVVRSLDLKIGVRILRRSGEA